MHSGLDCYWPLWLLYGGLRLLRRTGCRSPTSCMHGNDSLLALTPRCHLVVILKLPPLDVFLQGDAGTATEAEGAGKLGFAALEKGSGLNMGCYGLVGSLVYMVAVCQIGYKVQSWTP